MLYHLWTAYFEHFWGLPTKILGEILAETPTNHIYTERSSHSKEEMTTFLFLNTFLKTLQGKDTENCSLSRLSEFRCLV